jgi:hypothetical protein
MFKMFVVGHRPATGRTVKTHELASMRGELAESQAALAWAVEGLDGGASLSRVG